MHGTLHDPFDIWWWRDHPMTKDEIRMNVLRTQIVSLEDYGFHVFLWRWWRRGELP